MPPVVAENCEVKPTVPSISVKVPLVVNLTFLLGNELVTSVFVPFQTNLVVIVDFSQALISLGSAVIFKTAKTDSL